MYQKKDCKYEDYLKIETEHFVVLIAISKHNTEQNN